MPPLQHSNWIPFPPPDQIRERVFSFRRSWACEGGAAALSRAEDESCMRNPRCSDALSAATLLLGSTMQGTMFLKAWVETHSWVFAARLKWIPELFWIHLQL